MLPLALALSLLAAVPAALPDAASRLARAAGAQASALGRVLDPWRPAAAATFRAADREVSNWRREALRGLDPAPLSAAAALFQLEGPAVTRCVKLNNYWCIKRARWTGEIGADDEGHVGFDTAEHGAAAAVTLLRRYYLEFGRKSALDIVRRWAPAECRMLSSSPSGSVATLAVRGIGMTLRARWLASHRGRRARAPRSNPAPTRMAAGPAALAAAPAAPVAGPAAPGPRASAPKPRARASVVPLRPLPAFRVPDIAAGMGERQVPAALGPPPSKATAPKPPVLKTPVPLKPAISPGPALASASAVVPAPAPTAPRPALSCAPDEQRLQNYAARIVRDLEIQPTDDLKLFEADGRPLQNLARVLLAMSSVELGTSRASAELVENAVARATPAVKPPDDAAPPDAAPPDAASLRPAAP